MKKLLLLILLLIHLGLIELNGQWVYNDINIYNTNSGNVGIGTNTPQTLLYVAKSITEPTITIRNLGGFGGATYAMIDDASGANWKFKATLNGGFKIRDHANGLDVIVIEPNSAVNTIYIKTGGNLGIGTSSPHNSALLDLTSNSKGLLPPRMSYAQIMSIPSPAEGLLIYCSDCDENNSGTLAICSNGGWTTFSKSNCMNPPNTPTEGVHVAIENQIVWTWNAVPNATGYKWNTINDYNSSIDIGNVLSFSELSLSCNTEYNRFLWAYNNCGHSLPLTLTQSTPICWVCGDIISINHIAGDIAPVNKSVNYGTVSGIPGETSKCWITKNLGADQQANSVDDNTEASAGWYWQFNRKQGFKHDGVLRTPNTNWIYPINEDINWSQANDPCNIELGNNWRIPTQSEWNNVDNWTDWNGAWGSDLKLHAAGKLISSVGTLSNRGVEGIFWSTLQGSNTIGWYLRFNSSECLLAGWEKASGLSIRCIHD